MRFSIIIPVYNAGEHLCQCIESVINQTFQDWELILVNDGSNDNSLSICQDFATKDSRIRVCNKPNGGVSSARNRGLQEARGGWITFMDADDWLDDDALKIYYDAAQRTGADIIKTGYRFHRPSGVEENVTDKEIVLTDKSDILTKLQETGYYAFVCNAFFHKDIIHGLRFDETTPWLEDQFFGYECLLRANKVTLLPKMVYNYRIHESGSLSGVSDPFVIGYSARKDMEYKLRILGDKHSEVIDKCWITYHLWQTKAIDSLYRNGYSYSQRRRFWYEYPPIDGKCIYAEEKKFFEGLRPFILNDTIERFKRFVKR